MPDTTDTPQAGHPAGAAAPGRWVLDPARSSVRFASKTFWGLATVKGGFGTVGGEGEVLPGGGATGTLTIDAASLDTGNAKRDTHLRSADFFSTEEHPALVFTARTVTPAADGTVEVAGDLAIRGVTRPLTFSAKITSATGDSATLEAETSFARADFGMTWNQLGMLKPLTVVSVTASYRRQDA